MNERLQQLLHSLTTERDDFRVSLHLLEMEAKQEWEKAETKWDNLQLRLRDAGYKLQLETKEEVHDMGEEVDKLQHKLSDKVADLRVEWMEEIHELGEEIADLYQKIRKRFK
ncbi:hypothetical protein VSS37_03020 [Candidatus Thiothrix sp. Deng01]|uniref:Coiled coil domain-containing protein n=1 Tax=Candidatus Thiothrix phosphatis TaxID=3112415 RepID=A0ABU6CT30_9GAMM|nr:hypothetical protein [Candidatus Thiothrix sp. Deng01]MEB4589940.1 hypothetical protein [Candidatus Thiothrix sp. Deng01]